MGYARPWITPLADQDTIELRIDGEYNVPARVKPRPRHEYAEELHSLEGSPCGCGLEGDPLRAAAPVPGLVSRFASLRATAGAPDAQSGLPAFPYGARS